MCNKLLFLILCFLFPCFGIAIGATETLYDPTPYVLPVEHRIHNVVKDIFPSRGIVKDNQSLKKAGFIILRQQWGSGVLLARHPKLKGYIFKLYLDSQTIVREAHTQQQWLVERCRGAANIRKRIQENSMTSFTVPEKWLYRVPQSGNDKRPPIYILVTTFMHLVSTEKTAYAWKNATHKQLRDLLTIIQSGGASSALIINTPYTKEGKFVFLDTEYPDRQFSKEKLRKMCRYFSSEGSAYWLQLINGL